MEKKHATLQERHMRGIYTKPTLTELHSKQCGSSTYALARKLSHILRPLVGAYGRVLRNTADLHKKGLILTGQTHQLNHSSTPVEERKHWHWDRGKKNSGSAPGDQTQGLLCARVLSPLSYRATAAHYAEQIHPTHHQFFFPPSQCQCFLSSTGVLEWFNWCVCPVRISPFLCKYL